MYVEPSFRVPVVQILFSQGNAAGAKSVNAQRNHTDCEVRMLCRSSVPAVSRLSPDSNIPKNYTSAKSVGSSRVYPVSRCARRDAE
jgi:hypothetical protein